jgi:hypothetical protein
MRFGYAPSYLNYFNLFSQKGAMPIQTIQYIVYSKAPSKQFTGILGAIELRCVWLLLTGAKTLIEEKYDGSDPIAWYKNVLESQEMIVSSAKQQKYKGQTIVWLEVDYEKTPIQEFTTWRDIEETDTETLAWRPFWVPCEAGSSKECLGFAVSNREYNLQSQKSPIVLQTVLDAILGSC